MKSIRKAFFQSPALFFYTPQLEKLWEIIQDVNWFRELITSNHIFRELLWLCKMPRTLHFYAGYRAVFGVRALLNRLSGHSHQWHEYAMWYGMLSPYDQKAERQKWRKRFSDEDGLLFCNQDNMGAWFSVPVLGASAEGKGLPSPECCMDGYSFKKLRNSAEYIQTGKELHNCLTGWQNFEHSTVYKIMKGTQCVAAVEIQDDVILQAYTDRNGEIADNKNLKQAFDRWKDQNMLRMRAGNG